MKEIFKEIGKVVLDALKEVDWKPVIYEVCMKIVPVMEKKALASDSKVDDVMVQGFKRAVEVFLKPKSEPVAAQG